MKTLRILFIPTIVVSYPGSVVRIESEYHYPPDSDFLKRTEHDTHIREFTIFELLFISNLIPGCELRAGICGPARLRATGQIAHWGELLNVNKM